MNNSISKFILFVTSKFKPFLIKIMPIELLRKVKRKLVKNLIDKNMHRNNKRYDRSKNPDGINFIGLIKAEVGLGQSCRLIAEAIDNTDIEYTVFNQIQINSCRQEDSSWDNKISNTTPFNINLIHINPPDLAIAYLTLDKSIWDYKYNIAFWLWELEEFPDEWVKCFDLLDEIWTPSEFVSDSIRKKTSLPVYTMIYPISTPTNENFNRKYFKLPEDKFLYLCMYDSNSMTERKNPMAAINSFKSAFEPSEQNIGLIIKINNPDSKDLELINQSLKDYSNIYIINKIMTKTEVNSLIKNVDVLVSLHRAEGFGLPLAEAMLLGTPTIATNWSANTEFMNDDIACMVDFDLITLDKDYGVFKKGNRWADPNIGQAAMFMRKLYEDKAFYNSISLEAQNYIKNNLNIKKASKAIQNRINDIYNDEVNK
ncbi:MAG: glycosyltransferase [Sedimentibacter saalensis]|uniref:glycosyltransferase n=1 Tax=Sedimentibacter saalensis TaxID=130788 RepID=UPI002B1ECEFA|nr:glycosyltransferase [Sedimentibacter saalensis]MEA5093468.1 glycosyltransferase [Sedimentibacter saalensis]